MSDLLSTALAGTAGLVAAGGSVLSGAGLGQRMARVRRRTRRLLAWAGAEAEAERRALEASAEYRGMREYYGGFFTRGLPDVLAREAQTRFRQAAEAQGLAYGAQPAIQEAVGLARLAEQGRAAAAPILGQLMQLPGQIYQQTFESAVQRTGIPYGTTRLGPSPLELAGGALASWVEAFTAMMAAGGGGGGGAGGGGGGVVGGAGFGDIFGGRSRSALVTGGALIP